jgi:hypothetical protein
MADDDIPSSGAFAVVCDIAASWEAYAETVGEAAPGLVLHAAGPTDDGVRTIDVWESELAWDRHRRACTQRSSRADLVEVPVIRALQVRHLVHPAPVDPEQVAAIPAG